MNDNITMTYDTLSRKTSMNDPDMGRWTYKYDSNGNLAEQTDAKNQTIKFEYDSLNRITKKDYPTGIDVVYTYDEITSTNSKGRLTAVSDESGTTNYNYDKLGRTLKTDKTVDNITYTAQSTYDALGRTESITYPGADAYIVKYQYNTGGGLWKVTDNATTPKVYAEYTGYNALGQTGVVFRIKPIQTAAF